MEIGILGLPQSGKSTLFEIMTGIKSREMHGETCVRGQAVVPDPRFDRLVEIFQPERVSPARIPLIDAQAAGEKMWESLRQTLSGVDGIIHIVDGFSSTDVKDMVGQYQQLSEELILSDLQVVENRLERSARMSKKALTPQEAAQLQLLAAAREKLEAGGTFRGMGLSPEEAFHLRGYGFWTIKPELIVLNLGEDNPDAVDRFREVSSPSVQVLGICCEIEAELGSLTPAEQREYLASLGYAEPAFGRIIQAAFSTLGRVAFFTVGSDEVKSWVIPAESRAPKAAGAIHKDFERGFIKAEVISYDDFLDCGGSLPKAKSQGKVRLEGKEYLVRDGDIITFRFNV